METNGLERRLGETYPLDDPWVRPLDFKRDAPVYRVQDGSRAFVLKLIAARSNNPHLEQIYHALSPIHLTTPRLVLPVPALDGTFVSTLSNHSALRGFGRLRPNAELDSALFDFIPRGLVDLSIGNSHFDLSLGNIWRGTDGALYLVDFDDVQPAPYVKDLCELAAGYRFPDGDDMDTLFETYAPGTSALERRILLARPLIHDGVTRDDAFARDHGLRSRRHATCDVIAHASLPGRFRTVVRSLGGSRCK